jgi:hypothetical protein
MLAARHADTAFCRRHHALPGLGEDGGLLTVVEPQTVCRRSFQSPFRNQPMITPQHTHSNLTTTDCRKPGRTGDV